MCGMYMVIAKLAENVTMKQKKTYLYLASILDANRDVNAYFGLKTDFYP